MVLNETEIDKYFCCSLVRFNIAEANTKMLVDAAINAGFYLDMPKSLWKPCIIILNEELLEHPELKEIAEREF